ncbi:MAG: cbb3-type cytochrome oxidase subunit 3 [Planctomycetota bacterium]
MLREAATQGSLVAQILLLVFMAIFVAALAMVLFDRRRKHYDHMAQLPLEDDEQGDRDHG